MPASKMIDRFQGADGRISLIEVLQEQRLILGEKELAARLAEVGELVELEAGSQFITQGNRDSEAYLIIAGEVEVRVNDRAVAVRGARDIVGEMSSLVPASRSATVVATQPTLVLKVAATDLKAAADSHPAIWRHVTTQLVERLNQRNQYVHPPHEVALVFIICSAESIEIARAIQNQFSYDSFTVEIWTQETFRASQFPLESLERKLDESDFAIALATPDDLVESRDEIHATPRDNVIFELGMFVGRLGRNRSFLVEPRGGGVRLPSDLKGINTITYPAEDKRKLAASLAPACNELRDMFVELGPT
jgi:CRP/FNR family cyclic AMP-dependent transcriptional regulator